MKAVKTQKLILDVAYLEEEFFEEATLIGIVSPIKPYQFIWNVNEYLPFHFYCEHEHEKQVKEIYFSVYIFQEKNTEHIIYNNKKNNSYLLPELKNVDYVWMLRGGYDRHVTKDLILQLLAKMPVVSYAVELNSQTFKNRQTLIL